MLLRAIFWVSVIIMFLPVETNQSNSATPLSANSQSLVLFQVVASDLSGFCHRNPGACDIAASLARQYAAQVRTHAANLGDYLATKPQIDTGSITGSINQVR